MLINTVEGQECRIAIVENGILEELYVERVSAASHVGNIYKGRITNVEPSIQAAFVDFGLGKNGFLHISDVNPSYFPKGRRGGQQETVGRKKAHRDRPPIQDCLRRGQEVIVQLTKEGIGTKGPTLTTYLSVPGRLLVMMPGMSRLGVSRKIESDDARDKARAILAELAPPQDMGFIVRTAAIDRPKKEFLRDLNYLLRLWRNVKRRINSTKTPAEIYQESDLVTRTIRDIYNAEIGRIICDNQAVAVKVKEFLDVAMPRSVHNIELYTGKQGLFHDYGLEAEIEKIYARRIELPSGGSLVFDQAEALVAIDVNSGRFREHSDAETTATRMNMEAAKEIARQLRLRDLGGVVIIDFIDMREEKNRRTVERVLRDEMRTDRAKSKVLRISAFGIIEMTRQRVRPSLKHSIFRTCGHCQGIGLIKSEESQSLLVMRNLQRAASNEQVAQIEVSVTPTVAYHLTNLERRRIVELETACGKQIVIKADPSLAGGAVVVNCTNTRGSVVAWEQPAKLTTQATKIETVPLETIVPSLPPTEDEELELGEEGVEELEGEFAMPALGEQEEGAEPEGEPLDDEAFAAAEEAADDEWSFERERKQAPEQEEAAAPLPEAAPARPAPAPLPPLAPASRGAGQPRPAPAQQPRPQGGRQGRPEGRPQAPRGGAPRPPVASGQGGAPAQPAQPPVGPAGAVAAGQGVTAAGPHPDIAGDENGQGPEGEGGRRRRRRGRRGGRRHRRRQEMLPGQELQGEQPQGQEPQQQEPIGEQPAGRPGPAQGEPARPQPAQRQAPAVSQPKTPEPEPVSSGESEPWMSLFGGQDPKKAKPAQPAAQAPASREPKRAAEPVVPAPQAKPAPAPAARAPAAQAPAARTPAPEVEPKKPTRRRRGKTAAKEAPAAGKPVAAAATPAPASKTAPAKAPAATEAPAVAAKRPSRGRKTKQATAQTQPKPVTPVAPAAKATGKAPAKGGKARRTGEPILQDVEYYEQHKLEQKAAKRRRPTDEIPDEEDQDFSRE